MPNITKTAKHTLWCHDHILSLSPFNDSNFPPHKCWLVQQSHDVSISVLKLHWPCCCDAKDNPLVTSNRQSNSQSPVFDFIWHEHNFLLHVDCRIHSPGSMWAESPFASNMGFFRLILLSSFYVLILVSSGFFTAIDGAGTTTVLIPFFWFLRLRGQVCWCINPKF